MVDGADATTVLIVSIVFSVLATLILVVRILARYSQDDFWALDDYAFCVAFILTWGCAGCDCLTAEYTATDRDSVEDLEYDQVLERYLVASQICWVFAASSAKIAVLLFFYRASTTRTRSWAPTVIYILSGLLGTFWVAGTAFYAANRGFSLSGNAGIGAINAFLGVAVMTVPLAAIWSSDMHNRLKAIQTLLFGFGWVAVAFSVAHLATFGVADNISLSTQRNWPLLLCWSIIEPCIWLISGSVPSIFQLWRRRHIESSARGMVKTSFEFELSRQQPFTAIRSTSHEDNELTALPPVPGLPSNVIYHPRRSPVPLEPPVARISGPLQYPASVIADDLEAQRETPRSTPMMTRQSSVRTGMYTHWRPDDEDESNNIHGLQTRVI